MSGVYCNSEEIRGLLFADDAVIIAHSIYSMEANVEKLEMWCNKNKMKLDIDKCEYMIVNGYTEYTLLIIGGYFNVLLSIITLACHSQHP